MRQGFIFLLLALSLPLAATPDPMIRPQPYDFQRGKYLKICVPTCPLSNDGLQIQNIGNHQRFQDWNAADHMESYDMIHRIRSCWDQCGYAKAYLVYGRTSPSLRSETFHWEVVPYPDDGWNQLKQIGVIWNVSFGSSFLTEKERVVIASGMREQMQYLDEPYDIHLSQQKSDDPFCDPEVINKQCIHDGKEMLVLYNYAPVKVVEESPHFLIIPKNHRENFNELKSSEYNEAMKLAKKISDYFQENYPQSTLHLYHKTGEAAGQTVPHWHLHVVVVKEDAYLPSFEFPCVKSPTSCTRLDSPFRLVSQKVGQFCQSCQNFVYLMLPHRKLSEEDLAERVTYYQGEIEF